MSAAEREADVRGGRHDQRARSFLRSGAIKLTGRSNVNPPWAIRDARKVAHRGLIVVYSCGVSEVRLTMAEDAPYGSYYI